MQPDHIHCPILLLTEGVDLESQVPAGYACATCGQVLVRFVPRPVPEFVIAGSLAA
jgi:hypothetical protein